jgi:Uncharacterized protein conserved in bacteria (DUF2188)
MVKIPYKTNQSNPTISAYVEAVEKGKKNQHIIPFGNKWAITNLISKKASRVFSDQNKAKEYAKANATQGTAIFIHGVDGRIAERTQY